MESVPQLLQQAVAALGGAERAGQTQMAEAVDNSLKRSTHLFVQAGTGTGKSLAYLVPALRHAQKTGRPVVVATATIALQSQLGTTDMPLLARALEDYLLRKPRWQIVKGRNNYVCLHKIDGGYPAEDAGLISVDAVDENLGRLGKELKRIYEWSTTTTTGDRDDLRPGVSNQAWRQVSVSGRECLGTKCPVAQECFVEQSRARAHQVDIVITNHSLAAIDAFDGGNLLPNHDAIIIDEAHELRDRVTSALTMTLSPAQIRQAIRAVGRLADTSLLADSIEGLEAAINANGSGRLRQLPDNLGQAAILVQAAARGIKTELAEQASTGARKQAQAQVSELIEVCARVLSEAEIDVLWINENGRFSEVVVAPRSISTATKQAFFAEKTAILTSATLTTGGNFAQIAGHLGMNTEQSPFWESLDVGSPFDYSKSAIAYVAAHLPRPGRTGLSAEAVDEMAELITALGGRTLGLFTSMRAAEETAEILRERLDVPILCQGEAQMSELIDVFTQHPATCLFGTLTLWQGVDVPGDSCQLVIIDRLPFPRPDDPLASARSEAISAAGGNGFMSVSAAHAALLLAQGSGRLIRRTTDKGVVAFLDSRLVTARYGSYLQKSLPPFWGTTDKNQVLTSLKRLAAENEKLSPSQNEETKT